jgi:hypothetical protein
MSSSSQTGDLLHVEIKEQVDDPLYVAIKTEVDDPLHVEFEARTGEPLHVEFNEQVGDPLHVDVKDEVDEPLHVEFNTAVDEPLFVLVKDATGEPLYVEVKEQTDEPLYVEVKTETGEPLYVLAPYNPSQDPPEQDVPANPPVPVPFSNNPPVGPAEETTVLVGGRAASLAFLAQWGGWLPDHSYQAADLALDENRSERAWVPFGGVDAGRWRLNSGSHIKLSSTNMLLGLATRHRSDSGAALLGVFLEAGKADYDTRNHFARLPDIDGDGDLDAVGGGLMGRYTWNNDLRIEASLRTGRLKNKFRTKNYEDEDGVSAHYKSTDHYLAAHLGVGSGWQISEKNNLDLLLRYYWTRLEGGKATLTHGEWLRFDDTESRRVRVGGRLTHTWRENRFWYVGAAVERELDSKVKVSAHTRAGAQPLHLNLDEHDLKGTTTIGEIGVIIRSRKNSPFSLEAGFQGYAGKVKGVSGGIRIGYEF